jgi:hypothetical protein
MARLTFYDTTVLQKGGYVVRAAVALVRRVVAFEISLYRSLFRWVTRRPYVPAGAAPFGYVGVIAALLWVFIVVSAIEMVVVHLLLPWETVRIVADILGLWGLVWMLGLLASFRVHPHVVGEGGLRVRRGTGVDLTIPWDAVATVAGRERSRESSRGVQLDRADGATVLNVVMAGRTTVDVKLRRPLVVPLRTGPETVTEVRLFADDPRALVRAAQRHHAATAA